MATWTKVNINIQNIERETEKAVLISLPHNSEFDGFKFWFPKKLVRSGAHSYARTISIANDMAISAKRTSEKTFKVLAEKTLSADTVAEAFAGKY